MSKLYDIAIIGATPAGYTAACDLVKKGLSVVVIDAPRSHNLSCELLEWVSADVFDSKYLPKTLIKSAKCAPFSSVRYFDKTLENIVEHSQEKSEPLGYFVNIAELTKKLHDKAVAKKVLIRSCKTQPAVSLNEDSVEIIANKPIQAKFLLIAQNHPTDVLNELGQPARGAVPTALNVVGLDIPLTSASGARTPAWASKIAPALHVVELEERSEMGMFFVKGKHLHVRVISSSQSSGAKTKELSAMISALQKKKIFSDELLLSKATGAVWRPLAGGALDQEVHEAKRTLLIASAGGFSQSVTGHDLMPSLRSAHIASDTILNALKSKTPQDTLMQFTVNWRNELADYLRPPSTSLSMLVPLLFVNEKIVGKFTQALINGENI